MALVSRVRRDVMASKPKERAQTTLLDEILEEIFFFCPPSDLLQLALANRQLSNIASRVLHHTIPVLVPNKLIAFLTTIYFYEHRAPLVRSFSINPVARWFTTWLFQPFSPSDIYHCAKKFGTRKTYAARHILQSRFTLLAAALKKLHNLTFLELYPTSSTSERPKSSVGSLLDACTFQLHDFHITSFPFDRALVSFLETQPSLRKLILHFDEFLPLGTTPKNFTLPASSLLSLTTVGWSGRQPSMETIRSLIKGRPVYSVIIFLRHLESYGVQDNPSDDSNFKSFVDVGPYEKQIKEVQISFGKLSFSGKLLSTLRTVFTSLEYLQLKFPKLTQDILDEIVASVHEFDKVKHLVVIGTPGYVEELKLTTATKICFKQSAALDTILVSVLKSERKSGSFLYRRYTRAKGTWAGLSIANYV